ncbi:MAG: TauD/TfdA family dioxygenase [Colwellia sp.]|nr:TauD/TfdA family dioxygenase [Colwellia sp.]
MTNVTSISGVGSSKKIDLIRKIDLNRVDESGYQLIKNFGIDETEFKQQIKDLSNNKLYYSERMNTDHHKFKILPFSDNFSEQVENGKFHTDFMFQDQSPSYIALLCLHPDPHFPLMGRNQIVKVIDLYKALNTVFSINVKDLLSIELPFTISDKTYWKPLFYKDSNMNVCMKLHLSLLDKKKCSFMVNGFPFHAILDSLCNQLAKNIVLDKGDALIISNKIALHKRTECSIQFDDLGGFISREMLTVRFDY